MSVVASSVGLMEARDAGAARLVEEVIEACTMDVVPVASLAERALIGTLEVLVSERFFAHPWSGAAGAPEGAVGGGQVSADALTRAVTGPQLVDVLVALDSAGAEVNVLVEAIAAWERVIAWAGAQQAQLITAFTTCEGTRTPLRFLIDHLASRLAVSRRAAEIKVDLADTLDLLPPVAELMTTGAIDATKARAIGDETTLIPQQHRDAVLDRVLPDAPSLTTPQIRQRIRQAAALTDPAHQERRLKRETERRAVTMTPAGPAMAWLTAYLPADAAMTCLTALDALAANSDPTDPRGIDARRADALTDVLRHVLDTGVGPYGTLPTQQRRRPHIQVTVTAGTLLGLDDTPAELAGYGPIPATMARAIAADGTWRRLLLDDHGVVCCRGHHTYRPGADLTATITARDATCTFPGCRIPASRCDLDHIEAFDPERPAHEQTHRGNLHALCRHHHQLKTHGTWTVTRDPDTAITTWTDPLGRTYQRQPHRPPAPPGTPRPSHRPDPDDPPPF